MGLLEGGAQPGIGDVGIDLRRGQRCVAEEFLNTAQVGTALEQMGSHRMPQPVRPQVGCTIDHPQGAMDDPAYHPLIDPLATIPDEDRRASLRHRQLTAYRQPGIQGPGGRVPVRHGALFVALAKHPYRLSSLSQVAQIETAQLGDPDPSGIEQLEDRHVTVRAGAAPLGGNGQCLGQHRRRISTLQRRRQRTNPLRRPEAGSRILGQATGLHRPATEHPDGGGPPLQGAARPPASLLISEPGSQRSDRQTGQIVCTESLQVSKEIEQVAAVGPHGVLGYVSVAGQMIDVVVQRLPQHRRQDIRFHLSTVRPAVGAV